MNCPICKDSLKEQIYEGVEIDVCPNSHGVWLDYGELPKIVALREEAFDKGLIEEVNQSCGPVAVPEEELSREVLCPVCEKGMRPVNYQYSSGITIDQCDNNHGVWLDQGELEKIQVYMEKWEDEVASNQDKYRDLLEQVRQDQEKRRAQDIDEYSLSSFNFMNSIIRRVIRLME